MMSKNIYIKLLQFWVRNPESYVTFLITCAEPIQYSLADGEMSRLNNYFPDDFAAICEELRKEFNAMGTGKMVMKEFMLSGLEILHHHFLSGQASLAQKYIFGVLIPAAQQFIDD